MQSREPIKRPTVARWLPPSPQSARGSPSSLSSSTSFSTRWHLTNCQNMPHNPPTGSTPHGSAPAPRSISRHVLSPPTPHTRRVKFAASPATSSRSASSASSANVRLPLSPRSVNQSPSFGDSSFASFSSHSSLYPSVRAGSRTIVDASHAPMPRAHRSRKFFLPQATSTASFGTSSPASFASTSFSTASAAAALASKPARCAPRQVTTLPFSLDALRALVPYISIEASDVLHMHNTFSQIRMCPECGDDLPLVGQQLWRTNETPQDTASFLRLRCSSCQVDYCCGCLADWATCARDLCRPTFPESDAPCLKGCAIGVFEILDALDRACLAHPLRAEEVPLELKASCELLMRVLAHPFHNGEDAHRAVGVLLAASRLPALLVLLFARETETRVWVARAELYRAALGVLWRIVGTPEVLVGLVSLPRVLRTCGLRAWLAGQGEISWVVAGDGGGGIGELVGVLAERRLELQQDMVLADAEVKKVLALLVGDIIAVEKQARLASL